MVSWTTKRELLYCISAFRAPEGGWMFAKNERLLVLTLPPAASCQVKSRTKKISFRAATGATLLQSDYIVLPPVKHQKISLPVDNGPRNGTIIPGLCQRALVVLHERDTALTNCSTTGKLSSRFGRSFAPRPTQGPPARPAGPPHSAPTTVCRSVARRRHPTVRTDSSP